MRKYLLVTLALAGLMVVSVAGIAVAGKNKEEACVDNLCFKAGGGFKPKKISKKKQTPIALIAEGKVTTTDGSHPPALNKVILETDKNGAINVKHYPSCKSGKLQSRDTKDAEKACKKAIIGEGKATAAVKLAEQPEVYAHSKLLVVNGGVKGGTTTLYIHAYFSQPVPGALVTKVKIKKHKHGRYGTKSIATIPPLASGQGSITQFRFKIDKKFRFKHQKRSILTARCPDGRLQAHAVAFFTGGPRVTTEFVRPCVGKK